MLVYDSVIRQFGAVSAVDDVSIRIDEGSMVGIIGKSGAGKSTLLRLTNRLISPTSGRIRFNDIQISELSGKALLDWRSDCAMIFQQFNL
ncbi:MAG: ATP-binding cassette domain-containing protein, partial [Alphaproteobacteria bacterium]|nr:ATP-binding cassette domain-containing protein [Alphaproteobacteria bacterium]